MKERLGTASPSGPAFDTFGTHGLVVDYGPAETVIAITATLLASGARYDGQVFGVSLGDSVDDCVARWGKWSSWAETSLDHVEVAWELEEYSIAVQVWKRDGSAPGFGEYRAHTVKRFMIEAADPSGSMKRGHPDPAH